MKRVRVNALQVALVFKRGRYLRMLTEGVYWLGFSEKLMVYNTTEQFIPGYELNVLLQDKQLADALHVVEVSNTELVLLYENGLFKKVLTAGRYAFWKHPVQYQFVRADLSEIEITENINRAILLDKLVAPYVRTVTVESYELALLYIDGKYVRVLEPGVYYWWKNNIAITLQRADMRLLQLEINGQEMLTRDKAALRINAYAQYRVTDIEKAMQNKEYEKQIYVLFQLALRAYTGTLTFDELLERKDAIAPFVLDNLKAKTEAMGLTVYDFGIRDIILPGDVKDIMNQVLVAEKRAQANGITRREETASTRSLLNTAKLMEENQMLWKLKEMEYVEKIAEKISTISVNGNGQLLDQLKQVFISNK
ncbi:slipin family protein [Filimonas effusa]|uniref:Slipin family protein n=1 Tax=Filimonas effusa TaxID=2508721 RepID=A0A4Q1D916_9BACT|nr:slipin family protein [Filimonas effusa]RXK85710.1 slipin family protein [Filimonas effusa]